MKRKLKRILIITTIISLTSLFATLGSSADSVTLFSGTKRLINDLTVWAMGLLPAISAVLIVYFNIMKSQAEQQEQVMWSKRIKTVLVCLIVGECAVGLVQWLTSYYGG